MPVGGPPIVSMSTVCGPLDEDEPLRVMVLDSENRIWGSFIDGVWHEGKVFCAEELKDDFRRATPEVTSIWLGYAREVTRRTCHKGPFSSWPWPVRPNSPQEDDE